MTLCHGFVDAGPVRPVPPGEAAGRWQGHPRRRVRRGWTGSTPHAPLGTWR